MTKKTLEAAKRATAAAKRAQEKIDELAAHQKDEAAAKLVVEAAREAKEAELAAAEAEAEAQRLLQIHERIEKEDPTLWEQFKKWIGEVETPPQPPKGKP